MRELQSPSDTGLNALLGPGSVVEGKLSFKGQVRIEGMFTGEITTTDLLVVGETAKVSANINCGSVVVNGEVIGNIKASDSIELHKPARVKGDLAAPSLSIERGVVFEGQSMMLNGGLVSFNRREGPPKARGRAKDQDRRTPDAD
jgi:cytoskeletal protein CcmA (bactofilin family)